MKRLLARIAKAERRVDLMTARLAQIEGRHDEARELFAKHGIGYCVFAGAN